jgi:hypothetical protein
MNTSGSVNSRLRLDTPASMSSGWVRRTSAITGSGARDAS